MWPRNRRSAIALPALALALALAGCVSIHYARPGQGVEPRAGETLLFGRVRFFHDGREFFPFEPNVVTPVLGLDPERHLWFLRLDRRAVSAELHPDPDGTLTLWVADGDFALIGSTRVAESGTPPYEVMALFRVPAGVTSAYLGDLVVKTESHEGGHWSHGELGAMSATLLPTEIARKTLELRLGALPDAPIVSPWCTGDAVPTFDDPRLAERARRLLDRGCVDAPRTVQGSD